ncbi:MAG TPA: LuxR C-terminal-related transcriptional regulator [Nocardioidaceae bacterium]|nr:LuxR C-terminal-related transcriptional regulator [Nocardioidaceae bacterium]
MLEILVVPACFVVAGLIGYRLGTPPRVVGGLVALGCCHLLAFLGGRQALAAEGTVADWTHLASQLLFLGGFVAFVWLASVYPDERPRRAVVGAAVVLGAAGPLTAAVSGPTPAVADSARELGPVVHLLPAGAADIAAAPLMLLPVIAVVTFLVRYRRATVDDRAAMRWPIAALGVIAVLVVAGTLLGAERGGVVTALFLLAAPVFPLALAFGPVLRHLEGLSTELADLRERMTRGVRPAAPPGVLARLTPRELTVLESMAEGRSNPEIAKTLHLSLSSVEKHVTSIFRKLEINDAPETHRRVSAVVVYRDALDGARGESAGQ